MTYAGSERLGKSGRMAILLAGALLLALALGLVLTAGPANATHTRTCENIDGQVVCTPDQHPNTAPTISASSGSVSAGEGQTATNTGAYSDADGNSTVALSASVGTVTKDAAGDGTWRWSFATDDGPAQSQTVTVTATDGAGATANTSFTLTVNNLNPAATFNAPQTSYAGKYFVVSLTNPYDPSGTDRSAGFAYAFDCGSGFGAFGPSNVHSCQAGSAGTGKTVKGKIRDKDGGASEYTRTITVNAAPPSYPNGRIAFTSSRDSNYDIYATNSDGTNQTRLTSNSAIDFNPAFSPDGSKIAFRSDQRYTEIYVMNANGTNQTRLTNNAAGDTMPAFSPNGSQITFQSDRNGNTEIYVMNSDGTNQTRLTNNAAGDGAPAFSPNGSQITFQSNRDGGNVEIYVMDADGTNQTRLTNGSAPDSAPAFSPDGSKIAFQSYRVGGYYDDIYVMDADGANQTRLTNSAAEDREPAFSPDGSKIAFQNGRDANSEIYVMDANGTNLTRLTNNASVDLSPSWGGTGDTAPPETTLDTSGPSGTVTSTTASFSFSSEANAAFECKLDSGAFTTCTSPKEYTGLSDGSHTFSVRATDTFGNTDPTAESRTWTVDATAPTVTGVTPADLASGVSDDTNVTVTFSEDMAAQTISGGSFYLVKQGATTPVPAAVSYDAQTRTATLNPDADLDQATHTATVKGGTGQTSVRDAAGNPLAADKTWSFTTADTRPPSVSLTAPADGATVGGTVQLTADATDNRAIDHVEFLVNGSAVGSDSTAPYAVNWNSTSVVNGDTAQITARAIDTSSNQATSAAHTVTVDNAPPETTLDSGTSGHVNSASASFSFYSPEAGATFECKLDAQAFSACSSPKEYTGLSDGTHTFSVRARDAAGNVDATPVSTQWTIDTTAPTVTAVTPAADATGVAVSENVTAAFSEAMNINTVYEGTFTLFRQGSTTPVSANVDYDRELEKATLDPVVDLEADALYTATVEGGSSGAKDSAGNPLAHNRAWSFRTADTTAPPIPTITDGPQEGSTSTSRSATFTFGSEEGATFLCSIDRASFSECTSGQQFTGLADGPHRFEVKARDAAGNESAPAVRFWSVDATAPAIKSWTPKGTGIKPTAKPAVVFSEKMDAASVLPTTFFLKKGTTKVAATVGYVEAETATGAKVYKAILTPNKRLRSGAKYTVTVTTAAADAAGNRLEVTKTWRFTVK